MAQDDDGNVIAEEINAKLAESLGAKTAHRD
jgi:hypothetical protein